MIEVPNTESLFDGAQLSIDQKLSMLDLEVKTLSQVKERNKHHFIDYSTLQERKYNLRKTRFPLIVLSSEDITVPQREPRNEIKVKSVINTQVDYSLLLVVQSPKIKITRSLGYRKPKH